MKLTKIVATLSDKHCEPGFIRSLYEAGMNVVRINTAHQVPEGALRLIENVRTVSDKIPVMIDTKGPEIRTSALGEAIEVKQGMSIRLFGGNGESHGDQLFVSYEGIHSVLEPGNLVMIDDGDIALKVIHKTPDHLVCDVLNSGLIKNRKSVNLPGIALELPSLSDRDREYIEFAIAHHVSFIAHSFVRSKEDVLAIQEILNRHQSKIKIIAKIENQQGVDNIDEILPHVYGVMVARGDLAIEIPAEQIPVIQRELIDKCINQRKTVIVATQMLHSMITNPRPTRAEIADIANAVFSGTDALMLSGETAYGAYPLESVQIMARTARVAEQSREFMENKNIEPHNNEISGFLAKSAVRAVASLNARAIITDTDTGKTAIYLASFRGKCPIYAQCYDMQVMRELALNFGVYPEFISVETSKKQFTKVVLERLLNSKYLDSEDLVVVLAGNFGKKVGPSFVEVSTAQNLLQSTL
ncbi:MAG: pyruvate kinase [Bacteroidales bacterium]|nr:pyruvate kinase [Bacteroidales bacterium]MDZ4203281.1 pyruvate kinase [Bacteroidales bacterium]